MARIVHWQYLVDREGNPLKYTQVRFYLAGTSNQANIFLDSFLGSYTTSSVADLKTDEFGFIQFWVGDEWEISGGYESTQQFRIVWQNDVDGIQEEIDNLCLFDPVLPIDVSDSIIGVPNNKDMNKVISNTQGYRWDAHVSTIVPSGSPHGLEPVVIFDLNEIQNKVISNKLGYQMFEMADTASVTPIDISAARYYREAVSSWTSSGGMLYKDISHNFNNYYPIVKVVKQNDFEITPERIQSIGPNSIRVWVSSNITANVVVLG
jgi:hypothetical protein